MGITNANKELSVKEIDCKGVFKIKLSLTAKPEEEDQQNIYERLAVSVAKPGATDIVIVDKVDFCFKIIALSAPTKGTAVLLDPNQVQWKIDRLGEKNTESAMLEFTVQHVGPCSGKVKVNEKVTYSDKEGHKVVFPDPEIDVDCSEIIFPEPCPKPVEITIGGCEDTLEFDAGAVHLESLGRILLIDVTVKDVCPHRRVALAVILTEIDEKGKEHKRGMKILTVPAHVKQGCQDVKVRCIRFVLPEDLDVSGRVEAICNSRKFKARFIAHYIDFDFDCCDEKFDS